VPAGAVIRVTQLEQYTDRLSIAHIDALIGFTLLAAFTRHI
jgi:hypothetical protein